MRFDREISIKKTLKLTDAEKNKLLKTLGADQISRKLDWDTWDHPSSIPDLGFL
jgi:hypothetical protein